MRCSHFDQYDLEFAISKQLEFGIEIQLAEKLGVSPGLLSQYFNSNDERESPIYKAAAMFSEWIDLDPENGCAALEVFGIYVKRALRGDTSLCVNKEREKAYRERSEFQIAEASNKTYMERVKELEESIEADRRLLEAFRAEAKKEIAKASFARLDGLKAVTTNGRAR